MPTALLSVYDKSGIVDLARGLDAASWRILSSGGTARAIAEAGIPVVDVADVTGLPAILDHRVVTLHPRVHGGLLADPTDPSHLADMAVHGIEPIDLVVVATGYETQQGFVRDTLGDAVADRIGPVWGFDDGGELRNMWAPTAQEGLWFTAGSLAQCRIYSRYLALQIKAREDGLVA